MGDTLPMEIDTLTWVGFGVCVGGTVLAAGWGATLATWWKGLVAAWRGEPRPLPTPTPVPRPRARGARARGVCPVCGAVVYLRRDGRANRRYHRDGEAQEGVCASSD